MNRTRVPVEAWGADTELELTFPDDWGITHCTMKGHDAPALDDEQIRFVAAVGSHQLMMREDFVRKLGEDIVERYPVYNHNIHHNVVDVGETSWGTRVFINREVASCDLKVGIGGVISYFGKDVYNGGSKISRRRVCGSRCNP